MVQGSRDSFGLARTLEVHGERYRYLALPEAERAGLGEVSRLPVSLKALLENLLRHEDGEVVSPEDIRALAAWAQGRRAGREVAFHPVRVLMPDSSGIPLLADLAAMRDAMAALGGDPARVDPRVPLDLVVDHSVMVDVAGTPGAVRRNLEAELARNGERYAFLRWARQAFTGLRVVPPGTGICHQVNLEYLARVVWTEERDGERLAFPDALVGMDSHTPMVNGLGVLGWGVGGIEAAAAMLGQPIALCIPEVVGVRLVGRSRGHVTTTDLALTLTERLRAKGVLARFVEFCGPGVARLTLPERATLANMAPEYGATVALFPIDRETLRYLSLSGRSRAHVRLVEAYARAQGLWLEEATPEPAFTDVLELDLGAVEPSLAGPRRPQDRVPLAQVPASFRRELEGTLGAGSPAALDAATPERPPFRHGDVVLAAITSCTNTSNPSVMVAAGLLARNAVARGLRAKPWVKASLSPGSRVVTDYLAAAGLQPHLDALGFNVVGYGCMTCMGNSGPIAEEIAREIEERGLTVVAVLSGNRNFDARIHPSARASYLASPPLVVAYALAGSILVDLAREPLGHDLGGDPVYLRDIWPGDEEVRATIGRTLSAQMFRRRYASVFEGSEGWRRLPGGDGLTFAWDPASTYIRRPPFFEGMRREPRAPADVRGARPLLLLGDGVTTDHISPVSAIHPDGPAGRYLQGLGVAPRDFNAFASRRVNHEVMIRGTFANLRLRNEMVPGREGGLTLHMPDGELMTVYEAAIRYREEAVPLVVVAGREYGAGSSRDWAAKGTRLLGVRAVIAESFERIHRANLVGMGVLPLEFRDRMNRNTLGLDRSDTFDITGLAEGLQPRAEVECMVRRRDGTTLRVPLLCRIDTVRELAWYRNGGVLDHVLRALLA